MIRIQAFFEYNKEQQRTYRIERADRKPFYIAGLWDIWLDIDTHVLLPTKDCQLLISKPRDTVPIPEMQDLKRPVGLVHHLTAGADAQHTGRQIYVLL